VFTCVNIPLILELKFILPQQYGPVQPFDITKDTTSTGRGEDVEVGDGDGEDVEVGDGDGEDVEVGEDDDILLGDFLVKSKQSNRIIITITAIIINTFLLVSSIIPHYI